MSLRAHRLLSVKRRFQTGRRLAQTPYKIRLYFTCHAEASEGEGSFVVRQKRKRREEFHLSAPIFGGNCFRRYFTATVNFWTN
jgi:hypothetical protein